MTKDPYEVLGVSSDASIEEIRSAYVRLTRRYPPDKEPLMFQAVRRAYDLLQDPQQRAAYDATVKYGDAAREFFETAKSFLDEEEWDRAVPYLKRVLALAPHDHEARFLLGSCYHHTENYDEAIKVFRQLTRFTPDDPDCWVFLGRSYVMKGIRDDDSGLFHDARAACEQAVALNERHWGARYELVWVHRLLFDPESARRWAREALDVAKSLKTQLETLLLMCRVHCDDRDWNGLDEVGCLARQVWHDNSVALTVFARRVALEAVEAREEGDTFSAVALLDLAQELDPELKQRR